MKKEIEKLKNSDKYRLKYHLMPVEGLLNDPNGLIEKDGVYNIFYQVNDKECCHGPKKWGHYKSKDLINWEIKEFALSPEENFESHGCYSGSAVLHKGKIHLFYTGNVKTEKGQRESYQCLAVENHKGTFDKLGPIISEIPKGYTEHFRDPKVFEIDGLYYMVLGAQNNNLKGEVLLYISKDLRNWELLKSIYTKEDLGYMIECPDLFELDGERILLSSPQGIQPQGSLYNNLYQSGYMLALDEEFGHWWTDFTELDRGFDFYAPQTFVDSKGRRIMYAWMGMEEENHPTIKEGNWVHALTMPRELKIKNHKIIQSPLEELKNLRKTSIEKTDLVVENQIVFPELTGDSYEMIVDIENISAKSFGVKLRKNHNEEITIVFEKDKLILDRDKTPFLKGKRECKIAGNKHKLQIFMDTSSVEIFYNNGEEVFTSRVYVGSEAEGIEFFSKDGKILIKKLEFYQLGSFNYY